MPPWLANGLKVEAVVVVTLRLPSVAQVVVYVRLEAREHRLHYQSQSVIVVSGMGGGDCWVRTRRLGLGDGVARLVAPDTVGARLADDSKHVALVAQRQLSVRLWHLLARALPFANYVVERFPSP